MEKRDWARLSDPFKAEEIEWRVAQIGQSNKGPWVKVLAYVTARAIMDRLDEVVGPGAWKVSYRFVGKEQAAAEGVMCELAIRVNSEWVTKEDGADQTDVEAFKGGISSALKRAAVLWGIGRYLYSLEEGWGQIVEQGQGGHYAKTKEGTSFYWVPPRLPDWALPSKQLKEENEPAKEAAKTPAPKPQTGTAARPKDLPRPNSSEKSKPETQASATGTSSSSPTNSSSSAGKPASPSRSPFAKEEKSDPKRDALNKKLIDIYKPYLEKFPKTSFLDMLLDRYKVSETKQLTTVQLADLVTYLEESLKTGAQQVGKPRGKPPTDTERKDLWEAAKANGWTAEQMTTYLKAAFKVSNSKELNRQDFNLLRDVSTKSTFKAAFDEVTLHEEMLRGEDVP